MAAYMRKTGILPVCTNNEARAYFDHFIAVCGSFYITRDTMKIWLKLQKKVQK